MLDIILQAVKIFFVSIIGLCFGSFFNVVIYRLPRKINLSKPSSSCPSCHYQLKWYDNIPVFSYLFLKGKCRNCHQPISPRYMTVELLSASLFIITYVRYGVSLLTLIGLMSISVWICIIFIDLEHYIIPNELNIILGIIGIISLIFVPIKANGFLVDWSDKLIGFGVGISLLIIILLLEKVFKKEIMGGGDIKLIMATGLILGWQLVLFGIFLGSLIGVIVEIPLSFNKKKRQNHVLPFGPYLVTGFIIGFLYGLPLIEGYLSLFGI